MAEADTGNAASQPDGRTRVFSGIKFFLLQRIPLRSEFIDRILAAGGSVVKQETQAHYIIADHARKDCPPGSISYRFIEAALSTDALPDPTTHRCNAGSGSARPASSAAVQRKKTRTLFTEEEDRLLLTFLSKRARRGDPIMGNAPFREFVNTYGDGGHTWQSWRSRYVDNLRYKATVGDLMGWQAGRTSEVVPGAESVRSKQSGVPADAMAETGVANGPGETAQPELQPRQIRLIDLVEARKPVDKLRYSFTRHEIKHLVANLEDIPNIVADEWNQAWVDWADRTGNQHKAGDWKGLYVYHVEPMLREQGWNHLLQDISTGDNTEKVDEPEPQALVLEESDSASVPIVTDSTNGSPLKRKALSAGQRTPRKKQTLSAEHRALTEPRHARPNTQLSNSGPQTQNDRHDSISDHVAQSAEPSAPQRERLGWAFDQALQKKHIEHSTAKSVLTAAGTPSHRLTTQNLADQSRQHVFPYDRESLKMGDLPTQTMVISQIGPNQRAAQNHERKPSTRTPGAHQQQSSHQKSASPQIDDPPALLTGLQPQSGAMQTFTNGDGQSQDSALLNTNADRVEKQASDVSSDRSGDDGDDQALMPDFSMPSPVKPSQLAHHYQEVHLGGETDASHGAGQALCSPSLDDEASEGLEIAQICALDTQAILEAETQRPDFSFPMPDDLASEADDHGSSSAGDDSAASQWQSASASYSHKAASFLRPESMPSAQSESIDADAVEGFYDEFGRQGYAEEDITTALRMTCARPDLAEFVLMLNRNGAPIPDDVPGIWTAEEDEVLGGGDSRMMRDLEDRHGTHEFNIRLKFLEDLNDESQE